MFSDSRIISLTEESTTGYSLACFGVIRRALACFGVIRSVLACFGVISVALLRFIEVLLRPAILLYRKGVSRMHQRCIKWHEYDTITAGNGVIWRDLAGSGMIYGPLWPARGAINGGLRWFMAVYGGLFGRLLVGFWSRSTMFWSVLVGFWLVLVGTLLFQTQ